MKQAKLESLLGRPLTTVEVANRELYLKIATESLEDMLCSTICNSTEERTFETRDGFKTVFTGFFTAVTKVEIDGEEIDSADYSLRQWDSRNGKWYNSIVFDDRFRSCKEVVITADWGFEDCMPVDLQQLYAKLFGQVSAKNTNQSNISSKQVEDFRITYRTDSTLDEQFALDNADVLSKYSLCNVGSSLKSGKVCYGRIPFIY